MPYRAFFGTETEFAVSATDAGGQIVAPDAVAQRIAERAAARLHLPGRESGVWLSNGSRMYVDIGGHPEIASAETLDPWEGTVQHLAGDHLMAQLAREVAEDTGMRVVLRKGNVDYEGTGNTWGSHENFLVTKSPLELRPWLTPHLVSRVLYTGGGGLDLFDRGVASFVLSPRVLLTHGDISSPSRTAARRGLVDERDEPHCSGGYRRQHLSCSDSLRSHLANFLRLSTTALVIGLIEAGWVGDRDVRLASPLAALATVTRDLSLREGLGLVDGRSATALEIQRYFLQQVRAHLTMLPEWAPAACDVWQDTLERLERGPDAVADRLDWAIKLAIFRDRASRLGHEWPPRRLALTTPLRSPRSSDSQAAWRQELAELDMRFGMLHPPGLFDELDRADVLRHRVAGVEKIDRALTRPPARGRAHVRGRAIARLARRRRDAWWCAWDGVGDRSWGARLDLSDPFTETEQGHWTRPLTGRGAAAAKRLLMLARSPATSASSRHSIRACAERICAPGAEAIRRQMASHSADLNQFGVVRRVTGRLEDAEWLLRAALAIDVDALSDGDLIVAHRRCNLATVLMLQDRMAEALEQIDRAWHVVGSNYDWTSARFLTVRLALALLRGEDAALLLGQLKSHLAMQPLPRARFETQYTGTGHVFTKLGARFAESDLALLAGVMAVLNGECSVTSLDAHARWRGSETKSLELPWPAMVALCSEGSSSVAGDAPI